MSSDEPMPARGRPFHPGQSGNLRGRPRASEFQRIMQRYVPEAIYKNLLLMRLSAHEYPNAVGGGGRSRLQGRLSEPYKSGGGLLTARQRDLDRFGAMIAWYGSVAALCEAWPRRELKGGQWQIVPGKYSRDAAIAGIVRRCREAGEFHPESQVSGVGVWPNRKANGERELIVNFGGQLRRGLRREDFGILNGRAYCGFAPALPLPNPKPVGEAEAPGPAMVPLFGQFSWRFPLLSPRLIAGFIGAALVADALPVQPTLAIGGGRTRGSAAMLRLIARVLGPFLAMTEDASRAGVAAALRWNALALWIDPPDVAVAETRLSPRRPQWAADVPLARPFALMRLMSIETADMLGAADGENLVALELIGRPKGGMVLPDRGACEQWMCQGFRRPIDQYPRLTKETYPAFRDFLADTDREVDGAEAGAMLACDWMLSFDRMPGAQDFDVLAPELGGFLADWSDTRRPIHEQMADLAWNLPVEHTDMTVRVCLARAAGYGNDDAGNAIEGRSYLRSEAEARQHAQNDPDAQAAQRQLGRYGFMIFTDEHNDRRVAVAITAEPRDRALSRNPRFAKFVDKGGRLVSAMMLLPKARREDQPKYFPGLQMARCVSVPLDLVLAPLIGADPAATTRAWEATPRDV